MLEYELELAKKAALEAGKLLKKKYQCNVDLSEGRDIKLSSDKSSEKVIIDILSESGYPILSEECGLIENNNKDYIWIIDPLDGTANYWRGLDELSCVSIALWKANEPVIGVVYRFSEEILYHGIVGGSAYKNGELISTSNIEKVEQSFLATGFPVNRDYGT